MAKGSTTTRKLPTGIRRVKSGRYEKRFMVNGVRYSVYGKTVRECIDKETERRVQIAAGTYRDNDNVTLNDYFKEWKGHKAATVSPATMHVYETYYIHHIKRPLGRYKVRAIERRQLVNLFSRIAEKSSIYTANTCRNLLSQIFQSACYDEVIPNNIVKTIPTMKDRDATPARDTIHRALTDSEITVFMKAAKGQYYYNDFRFMLATGVRAGECSGLEWKDIDLKNRVIHINRTTTKDSTGKLIIGKTTKTKKSRRAIPINREVAAILEEQKAQNTALFGKVIKINGLVFPNTKGNPTPTGVYNTTIDNVLNAYRRANEKRPIAHRGPGLSHFSVHAFRDTFASKAAAAGVPLNVLKELMGHSSYAMTADLYGHIYEEQKKAAMHDLQILTV